MDESMSVRDIEMSRKQAHSRARGALFFVGFGAVWIVTGLAQIHRSSAAALMCLAGSSLVLLAAISLLMRRARDLPASTLSSEERVRMQRMFTAVNIIQWVAIATAVAILGLLHMPEYIVPAISIIVGLHLFPLAGSLHHRQHYITGILLLVWPLVCLVWLPPTRVSGVCALGVGVLLLLSAAAALTQTLATMRTAQPRNAVVRG
jgi:hypothetical protein